MCKVEWGNGWALKRKKEKDQCDKKKNYLNKMKM